MKPRIVILCTATALLAAATCGCGVKTTLQASTVNKTLAQQDKLFFTQTELDALQAAGVKTAQFTCAKTHDGTNYLTTEGTTRVVKYYDTADIAEAGIVLQRNKFILYTDAALEQADALASQYGVEIDPSFGTLTVEFDAKPVASNGEIDGNTVTFKTTTTANGKLKAPMTFYAAFNSNVANANVIRPTLEEGLTNVNSVEFSTAGIITELTVNGKDYRPAVHASTNTRCEDVVERDFFDFPADGTYTIRATLNSGYSKAFTFTYDSTAPTTNLKNKQVYTKAVTIKAKDTNGLAWIKLNGKKIKTWTKVSKNGTYKLVAKDKAGNKTKVNFTIKK